MNIELGRHKLAYFILLLGIGIFILYFFAVWPNRVYQRVLSGLFVGFYFLWGIMAHVKSNRLTPRVLLEYFAASLLIGTLLFLVTL
jgi:hypothetical protein